MLVDLCGYLSSKCERVTTLRTYKAIDTQIMALLTLTLYRHRLSASAFPFEEINREILCDRGRENFRISVGQLSSNLI
jgi:hypothetical protein